MTARLAIAALVVAAGCSDGQSPRSGIDALVQIAGAQFVPGAMPAIAPSAPMVTAVDSLNNRIRPGQRNKKLGGRVAKGGAAVAIGFKGDIGYWLVRTGVEDILNPGELTFDASMSFSSRLSPGTHALVFRATDESGAAGPEYPLMLESDAPIPTGDLVVSLAWDTEADLDLHVVPAQGAEVWSRKITSYQVRQGQMSDADAAAASGFLDQDSNSQCVIDGRRQENVIWKQGADSGHYVVRVDTFSLCGESAARWTLVVARQGMTIGSASGTVTEADTRFDHCAGSGVLALEFDL